MVSLADFPDYQDMFTDETRAIFKEIAEAGIAGYNYIDPLRKLKAINQLIEMMHELQLFRQSLSSLCDKQSELSKDKMKLQNEMYEAITQQRPRGRADDRQIQPRVAGAAAQTAGRDAAQPAETRNAEEKKRDRRNKKANPEARNEHPQV